LGPLKVARAYYYCGRCGKGSSPFDEQARLSPRKVTPAAEEVACQAGLLTDGFTEAAEKILPKQTGLHLSASTVERLTEDAGSRLGGWLEQGITLGEDEHWCWHKDKEGRRVAYLSVDATGVPQQGYKGAKAEGRMPYVAMVYNPPPEKPDRKAQQTSGAAAPSSTGTSEAAGIQAATEAVSSAVPATEAQPAGSVTTGGDGPPRSGTENDSMGKPPKEMQARYLAGLYTLPLLGLLLRRQAAQVGMEAAQQWIGLSDGGRGLEDFLQGHFNRADLVLILDFHHPAGRLEELARLSHEGDEASAKQQAEQWCKKLKHEGGEALLACLKAQPPPKGLVARQKHEEMLGYVENHKHKMNYPEYLKKGWYIGSGPVESACKTVVGQRLKLAGMRWGEYGTDNVCHLRALFKSEKGQWDAFWARYLNKRAIFHQPR
jgi:hypothetical protein